MHKFNGKSFQSLILINLYLISSVKTVISQLKDERGFALQYCQESDRYLLKEKKRKSLTRWSTPTPLDKKEQNTIHHIKTKINHCTTDCDGACIKGFLKFTKFTFQFKCVNVRPPFSPECFPSYITLQVDNNKLPN